MATIGGGLFVVAFVLHLFCHRWFVGALDLLVTIIFRPLNVLWVLLRLSTRAVLKAVVMAVIIVLLGAMYIITMVVPPVGGAVEGLNVFLDRRIHTSGIYAHARRVRRTLVEIVAEHDARSLEFESEDDYIAELDAVKARAERRLKRGESILSVVLGVVILPPTIAGVQLFQMQVYWWSVATVVQYYLIVVAVVVLYRVAIFDILSFTGDEAFDTLSEWDAALSYQRGLALIDFMQFLTLVVVIGLAITRVRFELFEMVLERKYAENLSFREWTVYAWQSLRGGDYR